jgi:hypothetical protein
MRLELSGLHISKSQLVKKYKQQTSRISVPDNHGKKAKIVVSSIAGTKDLTHALKEVITFSSPPFLY